MGINRFFRRPHACSVACTLPIVALLVGGGCSTILGFDDTTLRPDDAGLDTNGGLDASEDVTQTTPSAVIDPTSLVLRRGAAPITISVTVNRNGVTGNIAATLNNLPTSITASPLALSNGQDKGTISVSAASDANPGAYSAKLVFSNAALPDISVEILVADAAGNLDTTFGTKGAVSDASQGLNSTFYALAIQPDGSILAGGAIGNNNGWLLRRYSSDGNIDNTFSPSPELPSDGSLHAIAIGANGKIVCVGSSTPEGGPSIAEITVARLNSDGTLDATFGLKGVNSSLSQSVLGSDGLAVATLASGSVLVSGTVHGLNDSGFIARLSSDGTNDPEFNKGKPLVVSSHEFVGVAPAAAGAIVVGGTSGSGLFSLFSVARYNADGSTDTSFGNKGERLFGSTGYQAFGLTTTSNGSFVLVGGYAPLLGSSSYTAGQATPDGAQDWVRAVANGTSTPSFNAVAVDTNGLLVAAGNTSAGEARVMRLLANGWTDGTFGNSVSDPGSTFITKAAAPDGISATLNAIVLQQDDRIVVAGNRSDVGATIFRIWP